MFQCHYNCSALCIIGTLYVFFYVLLLLLFWYCAEHKILFHRPGMEPLPPAVEAYGVLTTGL